MFFFTWVIFQTCCEFIKTKNTNNKIILFGSPGFFKYAKCEGECSFFLKNAAVCIAKNKCT